MPDENIPVEETDETQAETTTETFDSVVDAAVADAVGDDHSAETTTEDVETQEAETPSETTPDPALVEKARELGFSEEEVAELGEGAEAFVDRFSLEMSRRMADIGRQIAEREQAAQPKETAKETPEPETPPVDDTEYGRLMEELEAEGFETAAAVLKAQNARMAQLEASIRGFQEAQQQQEIQARQAADAKAHEEWVSGLNAEHKQLLADPKVNEAVAEKFRDLELSYRWSGKQADYKTLVQSAFNLVAHEKLVEMAKANGRKEALDTAERRSRSAGASPAGRTRNNNAPETREEAIAFIREKRMEMLSGF